MVKAILNGTKTQTRRLIKPQPPYALKMMTEGQHAGEWHLYSDSPMMNPSIDSPWGARYLPPYQPGDILWVRETWKQATTGTAGPGLIDLILYRADEPQDTTGMMVEDRWHPAIHMRWTDARLFLQVKDVRAEQLRDISEAAAMAEGFVPDPLENDKTTVNFMCSVDCLQGSARGKFALLWNQTIKKSDSQRYGWYANPWVWVIEFERMEKAPWKN